MRQPPAAGAARRARARRLDQRRRVEPHLRAAVGGAGRGVRRRHVLRDVLARAAPGVGRARVRRHRLPRERRRSACAATSSGRSARRASRRSTVARRGSAARVSASASAHRRVLYPARAGAARDDRTLTQRHGRRRSSSGFDERSGCRTLPTPTASVAPADRDAATPTACACSVGSASSIPTSLDGYRAHGGCAALRARDRARPRPRDSRGHRFAPGRPRRRGVSDRPQVGRRRAGGRAAALPGLQRRRVGAGHVQGSRADGRGPVRARRGDDHRRLRHRLRAAGTSTSAANTRWRPRRLRSAIDQARTRGLLGDDVLGEGVRFDIELRRGAGAYICGEETALFNSIEGLRGEPRNKPPFPVQAGLFGKPTRRQQRRDARQRPRHRPRRRPGVRAASARPDRPAPSCSACRAAVERARRLRGAVRRRRCGSSDRAGRAACATGRALQAVLLGGAAGVFVTPDEIDMPLTLEGTRAAGATLGSGVVMLFDDTTDLGDIIAAHRPRSSARSRAGSACRAASARCGRRRRSIGSRSGAPHGAGAEDCHEDLAIVDELAQAMRDASICGLGQTASSAVQSAIRKLRLFGREAAR